VRLVNPRTIVVTGLTRDGLWWIEKGQIRYPVRNREGVEALRPYGVGRAPVVRAPAR